ncbi:hypothetical protein [Thioalkalivibrio sp. ALJ8]|nr:hypothetical protein [Thioalkalivibrio sp. ALJ8]
MKNTTKPRIKMRPSVGSPDVRPIVRLIISRIEAGPQRPATTVSPNRERR